MKKSIILLALPALALTGCAKTITAAEAKEEAKKIAEHKMTQEELDAIDAKAAKEIAAIKERAAKEGEELRPGIWYVFPPFKGDHMAPQGGLTKRVKIKDYYLKMCETLSVL